MRKSTLLTGALTGALLTAPLMALLYLAEQVAGLPFTPFDAFDWMTRTLPGDIITKTIETMVNVIHDLNLGETSSTAKRIESLSGLAMFLGGGIVAGVLLFVVLRRLTIRRGGSLRYLPGLIAGLALGVPTILISLHIGAARTSDTTSAIWLALAFAAWGVAVNWVYDGLYAVKEEAVMLTAPPEVTAERLNRRQFLIRVGATTATLTVVGAGIARYLEVLDERDYQNQVRRNRAASAEVAGMRLPNQDDPVIPAPGTRPEYTPLEDHYRIDINVRPVEVNGETWRLNITGLVDHPLTLSLDDLQKNYDALDQYVTLACISNSIGGDLTSTTRWTGASLQDVLAEAGLQPEATHLRITSEDGFYETVALDLVNSEPRIMLTYNWDGIPLLRDHGFPLRIYIPDRYGMKQPKWINTIEVLDHDEDGYWVDRGWDRVAQMRATSVIDVVATDSVFQQGDTTYVPIGGIAHAGARGISKVEVKIDDGEWTEATLRQPLSETTWVIWRYDWPMVAGRHTFSVRCTEKDGTPQIEKDSSSHPSGATGIHYVTRNV